MIVCLSLFVFYLLPAITSADQSIQCCSSLSCSSGGKCCAGGCGDTLGNCHTNNCGSNQEASCASNYVGVCTWYACYAEGTDVCTTLQHLKCVDSSCQLADNVGQNDPNTCSSNADCGSIPPLTHSACVGTSCQSVSGGGANTCASNADCVTPPPSCTSDSQCDDNNSCTNDSCVSGSCIHQDAPTTTSCDNYNNPCYVSGHCASGAGGPSCLPDMAKCTLNPPPSKCQSCSCDSSGNLSYPNKPDNTSCDPPHGGTYSCGMTGACFGGSCQVTNNPCEDNNSCTTDVCNTNTNACVHTNNCSPTCTDSCPSGDYSGDCTDSTCCASNQGSACNRNACGGTGVYGCDGTTCSAAAPACNSPHISFSPSSSLSFNSTPNVAPAGKTLTISNSGATSFSWTGSTNQSWCHISSTSGTVSGGGSQNITVTVDGLASASTYNCTITVLSSGADNSPQTVSVIYTVGSGSVSFTVSPTSFVFNGKYGNPAPVGQNLRITNTGTAVLNWTGLTDQSWCHLSPLFGMVTVGSYQDTMVTVDIPFGIGDYPCAITISY